MRSGHGARYERALGPREQETWAGTLAPVFIACLLGIALRLLLISLTPAGGTAAGDLLIYHQAALELLTGSDAWLLPQSSFGYRAPLYFVYLAAVYALADEPTYHLGQLANLVLVLGLLVLLYRVTAAAFGRRVATATVVLRSLLPTFVVTDVFILSEPLFDLFLLCAIWFLLALRSVDPRSANWFWMGFFLGCAILVREFAQGLLLILIVGMVIHLRRDPVAWKRLTWLVLGLLLILTPWIVRNTVVWGRLTPLALTSGANFHVGNHPDASGAFVSPRHPDHVPPPPLAFGTPETDQWHRTRALQYIRENPGRFVALLPYKLGYLVWPRFLHGELMTWGFFPTLPRPVGLSLVILSGLTTAALWILGIIGLIFRPLDRYGVTVVALLAYTALVVMASFGSPRFAEPILLLLLPFTIYALMESPALQRSLRQRSRRLLTAVGSLSVLGVLWSLILVGKLAHG